MIRRTGASLIFALLGFVSLVVADQARQWLCAHLLGGCVQTAGSCPIDVCVPDTRQSVLRIAVYFGPAVVFGVSAFLFGRRPRRVHAWLALLAGLVVAHALIMAVASLR
jgi:peptidoglycan/LPS O-acetylase OafA/YrhL